MLWHIQKQYGKVVIYQFLTVALNDYGCYYYYYYYYYYHNHFTALCQRLPR